MCPRHLKCHYFVKMYNVFLMITFFCPIWPIATLYQYMRTKSRPLQKFRQKRLIFSMNNQTYKRAVVTEVVSVDLWGILIQRMILNTKTKCRDTLTTIFFALLCHSSRIGYILIKERWKVKTVSKHAIWIIWLVKNTWVGLVCWLRLFKVLS